MLPSCNAVCRGLCLPGMQHVHVQMVSYHSYISHLQEQLGLLFRCDLVWCQMSRAVAVAVAVWHRKCRSQVGIVVTVSVCLLLCTACPTGACNQ